MNMQVSSAVPEGKGVSSSASVEVASMAAVAAARGNFIYQIFQTLRTVFLGLNLLTSFYLGKTTLLVLEVYLLSAFSP